jgi:hypothetical protein
MPAEPEHNVAEPAAATDGVTVEKTVETNDPVTGGATMLPASAANESPVLPPSGVVAAAKAHALLEHFKKLADAMQADIERWVPSDMLAAASKEVNAFIQAVIH